MCSNYFQKNTEIRRFPNAVNCLRKVCIRSYSSPYFPAFGLNKERYGVSFRIQFSCGKIRTKITPNTTTFYAVVFFRIRTKYGKIHTGTFLTQWTVWNLKFKIANLKLLILRFGLHNLSPKNMKFVKSSEQEIYGREAQDQLLI